MTRTNRESITFCGAPAALRSGTLLPPRPLPRALLTNDSKATVSVLYWYGNYPPLSLLALTFWSLAGACAKPAFFIPTAREARVYETLPHIRRNYSGGRKWFRHRELNPGLLGEGQVF